MSPLYKKELKYYLNNPIGYIVIVLFAAFANFLYIKDIFIIGSASMQPFFGLLPWIFLIFVPALSMRILSEEKRTNTIEVLLTLPVSETQIVIAKFLALMTMVGIGLILTLGLPVSLSFLTKLYLPEVIVGYLGALILAGAFIGVSLLFSSQTKNQVVAFLAAAIFLFCFIVIGSDFTANVLPKTLADFLNYFSPLYHLTNFAKGVIDFRSVVYFLSVIVITIFLTIINLEKRQ